jgi:hypothetical protein
MRPFLKPFAGQLASYGGCFSFNDGNEDARDELYKGPQNIGIINFRFKVEKLRETRMLFAYSLTTVGTLRV